MYEQYIVKSCSFPITLSPWIPHKKQLSRSGLGIPLTINNDEYILTCYDITKMSKKVMIRINKKFEPGELVCQSSELQLSLIKMNMSLKRTYTKDAFERTMCVNKPEMNIQYTTINSLNLPDLPYIYINDDSDYVCGLVITNSNNKITGMLNHMDDKQYVVIPSINIYRFISEFERYKTCYGLCTIVADYNMCELVIKNKKYNGIHISNSYNINYNMKTVNDKYGNRLQNNDIIFKINNAYINEKMEIYDNETKCNLPVMSYISLRYMIGDMINLLIYRNNVFKKIKLKARPISTAKYIPIEYDNKYYEYNGIVFMEASEELIEMYDDVELNKLIKKYYVTQPYRNGNKRIVLLVNILGKYIDRYKDIVTNNTKLRNIYILTKINKNKVNTLGDIPRIVNKQRKNTLYLNGKDIILKFNGKKLIQ